MTLVWRYRYRGLKEITSKVAEVVAEEDFASEGNFADFADVFGNCAAVSNVNSKIEEVEDIQSEASQAAFAISSELNDQIKAAAEADDGEAIEIAFADMEKVEAAQVEKEAEIIQEKEAEAEDDLDTGEPPLTFPILSIYQLMTKVRIPRRLMKIP